MPSPSIAADLRTHMAAPGRRKRGNRTLTQFTQPGSTKSEAEKKGAILPASLQAIEDCVFSPCLTEGVHSIYSRSFACIRGPIGFLDLRIELKCPRLIPLRINFGSPSR